MLNVNVICTGTLKEAYLRDAMKEYEKRLGAYCKFKVCELDEGKMLEALPPRAYNIALCIEGKQLSSEELAVKIERLPLEGYSELSFVIGASDGLDERIKAKCNMRLSFSKMTFPHQLMRVILAEQVYRAFTIINNGKYHK